MHPPLLTTSRLILRKFTSSDAQDVQELVGDPAVSSNLSDVPYPYVDGMAEQWIASHTPGWESETLACFAITYKQRLVGAISLMDIKERQAELGYWIGKPYWGNGYCTEAVKKIVLFAFQSLCIKRLYAHHLSSNPQSGKVLLKSGFQYMAEGYVKWPKNVELVKVVLYECISG
ncbi:MAG: GNAT family N-acetyltransferase [Gammaproteobacteria bacterium]|nr:GNAT family N-acetyltransferase [Gammaproteobacteria bacterium]NNM10449.1 GNAT family N-acetyltransferase [Pseudomonadales bacterium]RZV51378.1 MAG: N-acetyltransferase [Pseudomonadales bacterium]